MRRRLRPGLLGLLAALGLWQLGAGAWIPLKAALAQRLLERAWTESLETGEPVKPWPWADTWPVARLRVPELGVDLIVLAGDSGQALAFGPGLHGAGARPGGRGTVLISAHRDTHFRFLRRLRGGERITLQTRAGEFAYRAGRGRVFDTRREAIAEAPDARLALVTCYPFDALLPGGPLRYLVSARLMQGRQVPRDLTASSPAPLIGRAD